MNRSILISALLASLSLTACDKPTVVNVPPTSTTTTVPVPVPGPAGPQGATGSEGSKGEPGKPGSGTTLIVVPPAASAPAN